jgi:hypothetical protein
MDPTPPTSVAPHQVMQFVHSSVSHGVPMAMAVIAIVLALLLGLALGRLAHLSQ